MDSYLIIKDKTTLKPKRLNSASAVIEPSSCVIAENLVSGNDIEFTMPFRATDSLKLGDWVEVPSEDGKVYGGVVLGKTINKKAGSVTYKGVSARGALNGVAFRSYSVGNPLDYFTSNGNLEFYDLNGAKTSEYTTGSVGHNVARLLNACNTAWWNIPCYFNEGTANYIPYEKFQSDAEDKSTYYQFRVPCKLSSDSDGYLTYTPFTLISNYYRITNQKAKMVTPTAAGRLFEVNFCPAGSHRYVITDEQVIYSQGTRKANVIASIGSSAMYFDDNGDPQEATYNQFPLTQGALGFSQMWQVYYEFGWDPDELTKFLLQELIKADNAAPVSTQVEIDPSKLNADVGDTVTLVDPDLEITSKQVVKEKTFTIDHGNAKITYTMEETQ